MKSNTSVLFPLYPNAAAARRARLRGHALVALTLILTLTSVVMAFLVGFEGRHELLVPAVLCGVGAVALGLFLSELEDAANR